MQRLLTKASMCLLLISISACTPTRVSPPARPLSSIMPELIKHQVVLVGESHTTYSHHQNQLAVIKAMHQHWPHMGIGVEWVQSPFQAVLDDYIAGHITDTQMLKKTQWYQRWRYDFRLYREIFHYARAQKIPMFALNTPVELTRKISRQGIAGLSAKDRHYLPSYIHRNKAYRDRLQQVFKLHAHAGSNVGSNVGSKKANKKHNKESDSALDNFVDVQLAWDETMAMNAAKAIHSDRVSHLVLLAGSGHVLRQGIPVRLKRHGITSVVVVNHPTAQHNGIDFAIPTSHQKLPPAGKIGIIMKSAKNGVLVTDISQSHRGGLQKGDLIIAINNHKVHAPEDINIQLLDKVPKEVIQITIKRNTSDDSDKFIKAVELL